MRISDWSSDVCSSDLAESGAKDGREARAFFHTEYRLNHLLFTYPKPVVAVMAGITMGGGAGFSQPATYRVATENTRFALPETGIGLFSDAGGGGFMQRPQGPVGAFLAINGARSACAASLPSAAPPHSA